MTFNLSQNIAATPSLRQVLALFAPRSASESGTEQVTARPGVGPPASNILKVSTAVIFARSITTFAIVILKLTKSAARITFIRSCL